MSDQTNVSFERPINELADALAKAQGEFPVIPKDSEVEVYSKPPNRTLLYKYKYADLTTIIAATRPAMAKHGLSFSQGMSGKGFVTVIYHKSGQFIETGVIPLKIPESVDMKSVAGTITYAKRISLSAALGVSADEDVDAAGSEAQAGNSTKKNDIVKPKKPDPNSKAPQEMIEQINSLCMDRGVSEHELHSLITQGYGFRVLNTPRWVAMELGKLLDNEDTTPKTIADQIEIVASRRLAAKQKAAQK